MQFRDPTIKEVHENKMKELKMGGDAATIYFQKLEWEAKLANRCDDTGPQGAMVTTLRQGVPTSYTSFIANIGVGVLTTYDEWKEHILIMYKERQCNYVYNQVHSIETCNNWRPQGN